ncbi:hypothetical protein QBC47DRAFT_416003 [Echria macrotheca]|uniref:NmrA-like domain-containing protein n=1 Tax=Echria macrotheca TaxID=438768 RepID=A0AAJ0F4F5_9PEZI|nr:hypothetical protein QBC47DRAFT_416003 [Echria macrotheca]
MSPQIFLIGASGHIGAAVLQALKAAYPDSKIEALVRSEDDSKDIRERYHTTVNTIQGSLSDLGVVEAAASQAQIVINCAPDVPNSEGISAILRGLSSSPSPHKFYIQTSGAARVWDAPPNGNTPGAKIWDDISDLDSLPTNTTHAEQDVQVQTASASTSAGVHTAIISPTFVLGRSPSRTHKAPIVFPFLVNVIREVGGLFTVDRGENVMGFVDTEALAGLYLALVADAVAVLDGRKEVDGEEEVWGARGFYFAASLEMSFREFVEKWFGPALERAGAGGLLGTDGTKEVTVERVTEIIMGKLGSGIVETLWSRHIAEGFGTSMRVRGTRAEKVLGYRWVEGLPGLGDAVEAVLEVV